MADKHTDRGEPSRAAGDSIAELAAELAAGSTESAGAAQASEHAGAAQASEHAGAARARWPRGHRLRGHRLGDHRPRGHRPRSRGRQWGRDRVRAPLAVAAHSSAQITGRGIRAARRGMGLGTGWLAGQVIAMAPRLRVRDQAALQAQFPGRSAEEIADALIEGAARASAAVGGAVGAWAALPVLPAFPAELATETLALIGIEIKLVAELHEAYGMAAPGNVAERTGAYVAAWANRRGIALAPGGLFLAAGSPLARRVRRRLAGRAGRSAFSLGPLLSGAAAGALLNRRETHRLGHDVHSDLRRRAGGG